MQRPIWLLLLFLILLQSCNPFTRREALYVNNTIVAINDSLYLKGKEYGNLITSCYQTKDYKPLRQARISFEHFIATGRQRIGGLKDAGGSEALKNCEIGLLGIEQHMVENDFTRFEQLTPASTTDDIATLYATIQKDAKGETEQMQQLQALQASYAHRNGFILQTNTTALK